MIVFTLLDFSDAKPFFVTTGKKMRRTNIVLKKQLQMDDYPQLQTLLNNA